MSGKHILVFHPALAPYRIDFFNSINKAFDASFYFLNSNLLSQKFDQSNILNKAEFKIQYLTKGFNIQNRSFRSGINKILKNEQPDVVICSEFNPIIVLVAAYRFRTKKRIIIHTICDDNLIMTLKPSITRRVARGIALHVIDGIILTNNRTAEWYAARSGLKVNIMPIIQKELPYRKELANSIFVAKQYIDKYYLENKKVFLFVGRLAKEKNLERLIDAFRLTVREYNDARLIIVGSGYLEQIIKDKVQLNALHDSIIFPGRLEGCELLAWYLTAGVFILPSTKEPFGAVINEALLAGCYALVSKISGGACLIKEDVNGNLLNPLDVKSMAEKLMKCAKDDSLFSSQGRLRNSLMLVSYDEAITSFLRNIDL